MVLPPESTQQGFTTFVDALMADPNPRTYVGIAFSSQTLALHKNPGIKQSKFKAKNISK